MVLSYWRSSAELEDLSIVSSQVTWTHWSVTLGIVVKCDHATTLPDLQASALDLQWYHGNRMLTIGGGCTWSWHDSRHMQAYQSNGFTMSLTVSRIHKLIHGYSPFHRVNTVRGTSLIRTPLGPKQLSWLVKCPYFRGKIICIYMKLWLSQDSVLINQVPLFQRWPLRARGSTVFRNAILEWKLRYGTGNNLQILLRCLPTRSTPTRSTPTRSTSHWVTCFSLLWKRALETKPHTHKLRKWWL